MQIRAESIRRVFSTVALAAISLVGLSSASEAVTPSVTVTPEPGYVSISWLGFPVVAGSSFVVVNGQNVTQCSVKASPCRFAVKATAPTVTFRVKQLSSAGAVLSQSPWSSSIKTIHLIVVAGQSNAAGAAAETKVGSEKFSLWSGPGRNGADGKVDFVEVGCAMEPVGPTPKKLNAPQFKAGTKIAIFGPEVGIARALWNSGWKNVAINKVTCGGTDLEHFWYRGSDQFTLLINTTIALENWYAAHNTVAVLSGGFWVQGETDSQDLATANDYFQHAYDLISSVRLATTSVPTFPIVAGSIDMTDWIRHTAFTNGQCQTQQCLDYSAGNIAVRSADVRLAKEIPNTYLIDTKGLPRDSVDFVHITSAGMVKLGALLGAKFLTVAKR